MSDVQSPLYDPSRPAPEPVPPAGTGTPTPEDAPKSAIDAQAQAFVEEAEDAGKAAQQEAEKAKWRAGEMERKIAEQESKAKQAPAGEDVQKMVLVPEPSHVTAVSGPRNVDMVTSEEDRLLRHKAMVRDHLRNADPDMTGGVGSEEPEIDPATGLPKGHVPEGHQDARMIGGRDDSDPVYRGGPV